MAWEAMGDWGTTRLRLMKMVDGHITGRVEGAGIGDPSHRPEAVLRDALIRLGGGTDPASIRLCGMAGARNALHEVPYALCPASTKEWASHAWRGDFEGIRLQIAAGLAIEGSNGRPDVMRGEETQLFGALALAPELAEGRAIFVLPGTHSKWVVAQNGRIESFHTFLTGEIYSVLTAHSTLVAPDVETTANDEESGFSDGLARAMAGSGLAASLFEARSAQLRHGRTASWARGFLSGLLIGDEATMARRIVPDTSAITLIGAAPLCCNYAKALAQHGVSARQLDGNDCALKGLELLNA